MADPNNIPPPPPGFTAGGQDPNGNPPPPPPGFTTGGQLAATAPPSQPPPQTNIFGGTPAKDLFSVHVVKGAFKELEKQLGNFIEEQTQQFTGYDQGQGPKPAQSTPGQIIQGYNEVNTPLEARAARALPESVLAPVRHAGEATAAWLKKNTDQSTIGEKVGGIGTNVGEFMAVPEGEPEKVLEMFGEHYQQLANVAKLAKKPGLTGAGARATLHAVVGGTKNAVLAGGQEALSSGDADRAATSGEIGGVLGAVLDPFANEALRYVSRLRSGETSMASGLMESLFGKPEELPARPIKPDLEAMPAHPRYTATGDDAAAWQPLGPKPTLPEPPQLERKPTKPLAPPPLVPSERPEMPVKPAPLEKPTLEPTPRPEKPEYVPPAIPSRAPVTERVAQQEAATAQGALADKYAQEAQTRAGAIGNPEEAAQHLETLTRTVEDPGFTNLPPERQAEILQARKELLRRAQPAADPRSAQEMLDQIGSFGAARDALQARPKAAYQDWGAKTKGEFTTLNDQDTMLRGRFDADSLKAKAENEKALQALYKKTGVASPIDRAVYRSQWADSYVLDDADKVFTNAFKGADKTGELDPAALQRNWKGFVNKTGAERVKSVIGPERYEAMNKFINDVAGEDAADVAARNQARADFQGKMADYRKQIQNANTLDQARQAALDAKHEAAQMAQDEAYNMERDEARLGIRKAKAQDRQAVIQRAQDYQQRITEWQEQVLKSNDLNAAKQATHDADVATARAQQRAWKQQQIARGESRQNQIQSWEQAKEDVKARNEAINQQHLEDLGEWRSERARIQAQMDKRKSIMNLAGYALRHYAGIPTAVKTSAWILSKIAMNPRVAALAGNMARIGGKPEVYWPIMHEMMNQEEQP